MSNELSVVCYCHSVLCLRGPDSCLYWRQACRRRRRGIILDFFFFNLSPFCSCAVGGPRAWRQICSMASELGAGDDGSSTELAKPLYLQYLERALRLDHFLRQTSAIFNRNISRCVILSLDSVLLHFWFLSLGFKVKLVWFLLLAFSSSFFSHKSTFSKAICSLRFHL